MGRRLREGTLMRIGLGGGATAFARVLPNSQIAVYAEFQADSECYDLERVYSSPVLFKLSVMKTALANERWPRLDYRPLEPELAEAVLYRIKGDGPDEYEIYRSSDGAIAKSDYESVRNLEAAAVWDPEHVEDRIRDHVAGRENRWVRLLNK